MNTTSRVLIECDRAVGFSEGLKIVAVLEAYNGITVRELAELLRCGSQAAKWYIKAAVERGWLYKTDTLRDTCCVYRCTDMGNLLTTRLSC